MTTIATDGQTIAGDSQDTLNGAEINYCGTKLYKLKDGRVAGITGEFGPCMQMIRYLNGEITKQDAITSKDEDMDSCLVIAALNRVWIMNSYDCEPYEVQVPFASGSGGPYARGALEMGANAREAVKIAAKYDAYTGGKIHSRKLKEVV